jgi:hypothetical protein
MAPTIQALFIDPPIAIARLGGSAAPQDAYCWAEPDNPRSDGNTVIAPWWTLEVLSDATVDPRMPTTIRLRDGDLIRPVAPFLEIWALVGEPGSPRSQWRAEPLTPKLLRKSGIDESRLTIEVDAKNRKAARRRRDDALIFGTFPPVVIKGDDHNVHLLLGTSPPDALNPMIPPGRSIPLGNVQIMRSREQPKSGTVPWANAVDVEVIRFRFTPARGEFYGPGQAAQKGNRLEVAVDRDNAFLNPEAGWFGERAKPTVQPSDTYDAVTLNSAVSLGVVDDTCGADVTVTLVLPEILKAPLVARANVFVGPPDFGPDRRPFLSLADELADRGSDAAERNAALSQKEREAWVRDLFERIYETVSLFNLDHFQRQRSIRLRGARLRTKPIFDDGVTLPRNHAMTNRDALRNDSYKVSAHSVDEPLPLSEHARTRHLSFQDTDALRELIAEFPDRLQTLIRQPFQVEEDETADGSTMRMPPFMRNSNAFPLTLAVWQYELLMEWVKSVSTAKAVRAAPARLSEEAESRRRAVLARLDSIERR